MSQNTSQNERVITLRIDENKVSSIPRKDLSSAVGYLSTWALERFNHVTITNDRDEDLVAYYSYEPEGETKYVIGAVWRGESYSFHS
jgi:hypothetical protein